MALTYCSVESVRQIRIEQPFSEGEDRNPRRISRPRESGKYQLKNVRKMPFMSNTIFFNFRQFVNQSLQ